MASVKDDFPDHIMALVGDLMDGLRRDVAARMQAGPKNVQGLRSSQLRLLSLTPTEGMRVTDLAARLGMTKQALGEFANALEEQGLLESVRDDRDRRIRILRPTARGRKAVADGEAVIDKVEQDWRSRVGAKDWQQLRELLIRVTAEGRSGV